MLVEPQLQRVFGTRGEARLAAARRWAWVALVVVCVVFYVRTLGYGLYLDDYWLVRSWSGHEIADAFVSQFDPSGLNPEYFRPLASVSFAVDWAIWGSTTWGSHVTNLLLHIAAVLLLHRLLHRLGLRWWAAFAAAVYFAIVPSNVATVVYVAQRTDAMAAICIIVGLLCVRRYDIDRRPSWLVGLAVAFLLAVLSKEIGLALVPMTAVWWWYLRVEAADKRQLPAPTEANLLDHWKTEAQRWWRALADRSERRGWMLVVGPLVALTVAYVAYRSAVLPSGGLSGRFGESQSPLRAMAGGVSSTVKGVPWELRSWTLGPLAVLFVGVFVLAPRSRGWRVVILGTGLMVAGVAPLAYSGGVEPRLLYVAELGMAVAMAGVLSALGDGLAVARTTGRRERPLTVGAAAVMVAVVLVTGVLSIQAQDQFAEGSAKKLQADLDVLTRPGITNYVLASRLEAIRERLDADGLPVP